MNITTALDNFLTKIFYDEETGECLNYGKNGEDLWGYIDSFFYELKLEYCIDGETLFTSPGCDVGYVAISWIEDGEAKLYCWNWRII